MIYFVRTAFYAAAISICVGYSNAQEFTIIALPDTQNYVSFAGGGTPEIFAAQTRWIVRNRDSLNIVFVTHLGDFVQNGDDIVSEWDAAEAAMMLLEDSVRTGRIEGIPYGIAVGNHDQSPEGDAHGSTAEYNRRFGVDRFTGRAYYGGHYGANNDNHFEYFTAGSRDFIFLHLEFDKDPSPVILSWADSVLSANSNRYAFLSTHYLVGPGNPASFGRQGAEIYESLKHNPNLIMMFGGHVTGGSGEGQRTDRFGSGTIHSILSDYQSYDNGGDGWLRIMQFLPSENRVIVRTFSPTVNDGAGAYITDESSEFELLIEFIKSN